MRLEKARNMTMKDRIKRVKTFFLLEIWTTDLEKASRPKRFLIRSGQMLTLSVKSFKEDKLNVNASALTYFTMLSIVPVLALGFGIAKGFGLEAVLEDELAKNLAGQQEAKDYILQFTKSMLNTTKGGLVAGIGVVLLMWSVIKLLTNIENSFNTVWNVKKGRTILRKFTDYTSIVMLGPIIMIVSGSVTIYISTQFTKIAEAGMFEFVSPVGLWFAKLIPFGLIWILFTLLYLVMPNAKVKFKSAFIAAMISGTVFQVFQGLYVDLQSSFTRINAIYGSFAALPLFLIWLQISWFVLLLGTEISFVVQNLKLKSNALMQEKLSPRYQSRLALYVARILIQDFKNGKPPGTIQKISDTTHLPFHTVENILSKMHDAGIVSKVVLPKNNFGFQPAQSIENLSLYKVTEALDTYGVDDSKFITAKAYNDLGEKLNEMKKSQEESPANILLKDLS